MDNPEPRMPEEDFARYRELMEQERHDEAKALLELHGIEWEYPYVVTLYTADSMPEADRFQLCKLIHRGALSEAQSLVESHGLKWSYPCTVTTC